MRAICVCAGRRPLSLQPCPWPLLSESPAKALVGREVRAPGAMWRGQCSEPSPDLLASGHWPLSPCRRSCGAQGQGGEGEAGTASLAQRPAGVPPQTSHHHWLSLPLGTYGTPGIQVISSMKRGQRAEWEWGSPPAPPTACRAGHRAASSSIWSEPEREAPDRVGGARWRPSSPGANSCLWDRRC